MNTDNRHDIEAAEAHIEELAQLRKDKARLGTIIREWQIFGLALSAKLGCIAITDDMLQSVDKLHSELPQMRAENQRLMAFIRDADAYVRLVREASKDYSDNLQRMNIEQIVADLQHDFKTIIEDEPNSPLKVSGFAEKAQKL